MSRTALAALALAALCLAGPATAQDDAPPAPDFNPLALTAEEFLGLARRPPLRDSWCRLSGMVDHKSEGRTLSLPVEFRARFTPERILGQVVLDDHERYAVAQVFAEGMNGTSVIAERPAADPGRSLTALGIRPSDLTLSFLYWQLREELPNQDVRGQRCRVFRLAHPAEGEEAVVAIATRFFFPLETRWYKAGATEPYRELSFTDFRRQDDVWVITEARLSNPGWKTRVRFTTTEVAEVTPERPIPPDLFRGD